MYVIVGCDFGLAKSGIVCLDQDFGILSQNLIRVGTKGAQRLVDIEKGFNHIVSPFDHIEVFVEGYAYGAKYQRESLAELGGVMRRYFCLHEINYWVIPPTNLKYFVTGVGRATKNYVKKCTKDKWGLSFKSDDVCDAYGLARLGVTTMKVRSGEDVVMVSHERDTVLDIINNQEFYKNGNTAKRSVKRNDQRKTKTKSQSDH